MIKNNRPEDLMEVIESTIKQYKDCDADLLSAIVYKNVVAHIRDIGNFVHSMEQATKNE